MRKGVWPDPPGDWPLPAHAQAPSGFVLIRPRADGRAPDSDIDHDTDVD